MEFSSKANNLKFLQTKLKKSKIEKIYDFKVFEWENNQKNILEEISNRFKSKIIIRSSATGEDSVYNSEAGNYESILNIHVKSKKKISSAINKIINSYKEKNNFNQNNQILIQEQASNVVMSGVVFTKTEDFGAPYYVINFDEGKFTDTVTKGETSQVVKIFHDKSSKLSKKFEKLISSIKEIETIYRKFSLDIEFAISKSNEVIIFQVRPITFLRNKKQLTNSSIKMRIKSNQKKFDKISNMYKQNFKKIIFSDMADWNPSEIIGNNPNRLDYSLYNYLLLEFEWLEGRKILGYQQLDTKPLMYKFGNKPYIDLIASFESMIPDGLNNSLQRKLIKYYLEKIDKNHELHDKVEFEILFSCYDFTINERLKELKKAGFTNNEISELKKELIEFTNSIFKNFLKISIECSNSIKKLSTNRKIILNNLQNSKKQYKDYFFASEKLLKDCKQNGTLQFSTMARIGFIASILLKSMIKCGYIDQSYYDNLMFSLETPLTNLKKKYELLLNDKISKKEFLEEFGHLRPGTYDITASRYDKNQSFFENIKFLDNSSMKKIPMKKHKIDFLKHKLKINWEEFESFLKNSLIQREELKFEFTRNLSDSLECIAIGSNKIGFKREEIANLEIKSILKDLKKFSKEEIKKKWKKQIAKNISEKEINQYLVLPPIISSSKDFEVIQHYTSKPNFISRKKVTGKIIQIKKFLNSEEIENNIVILENADPGYDWIFTKNLKGLITKYGGVASHMAIRCSEVGIPAAIGCGDILYEKLSTASEVMLDCKNQQIIILKQEFSDEFMEEKKALKSLGYIK